MFYNKIMNDKYYQLYKNYKTDFSISEVEPILNFTNYNSDSMNKDLLNKLAIVKLKVLLDSSIALSFHCNVFLMFMIKNKFIFINFYL